MSIVVCISSSLHLVAAFRRIALRQRQLNASMELRRWPVKGVLQQLIKHVDKFL